MAEKDEDLTQMRAQPIDRFFRQRWKVKGKAHGETYYQRMMRENEERGGLDGLLRKNNVI